MFCSQQGRQTGPSSPFLCQDCTSLFAKRMPVAKLHKYLSRYWSSKPDLLICSKQCGLLVEAMQKVASWLSHRGRATLPSPFVQHLLTLATKGVRLLEDCKHVSPSTWLTVAALKMESREQFLELFQGFLQALESYVEVMQGPHHPYLNTHRSPRTSPLSSPAASSTGLKETCIHEVTSMISALKDDFHFLPLKAAEDRRAIFERLEQSSFMEEEEMKICQFLMQRLEDEQKDVNALQLDSPGISKGHRLGHGTYGVVYEVTWMGRSIAVKEFNHQSSLDAELKALLVTSHVNVVRVVGYVAQVGSSNSCLLMELMKGDLGQFVTLLNVAKSQLPLSVLVEILLQIATGMAHLHVKNIMHRDLKPENILFDRWPPMSTQELHSGPGDFTAKITDFGNARTQAFDTTHATAGHGTACYRAPEILKGADESGRTRYSNKVDVFSFGMVCYKLLTGLDPCFSRNRALQGDFTELHIPLDCPWAFSWLMERCWAPSPQRRPSFAEICNFLALFKSIVLNTTPINGFMPLLYSGIRDDLLVKLVAFLGKEWLIAEAISLGIKIEFTEGMNRVEIDEAWLRLQVRNKCSAEGDYRRWLCW